MLLARVRVTVVFLAVLSCSGCATSSTPNLSAGEIVKGQIVRGDTRCNPSDFDFMMRPNRQEAVHHTPVQVPADAALAIRRASQLTGASAHYLAATAFRESRFRAEAVARSSSAQGMFQFIEQTWLAAFAQHGECIGKGTLARHIQRAPNGRHVVANHVYRRWILSLRNDPLVASILAARLAQSNAKVLTRHLGRRPTPGEVYVTHFLGPSAGLQLIMLAYHRPWVPAADHFPREASANKAIFFSDGRPNSTHRVWEELIGKHDRLHFVM